MSALRLFAVPVVILLTGFNAACAEVKKVLAPGDPPLTQEMVDDYTKLAEWRLGPALANVGGAERLAQMIVNDWRNGDKARQKAILADLKWWREDYPKLAPAVRERLAAKNSPSGEEQARQSAQAADAIHRLKLQQWHDARQQEILALSNLQAKHHELMMLIIGNLRPTGRYEYNPATGRYDRYVP